MSLVHPQDPGREFFNITASNSTNISFRGLYVGSGGDVKIKDEGGADIVFSDLAAGMIHPIGGQRVYSTGTTASNIIGVK